MGKATITTQSRNQRDTWDASPYRSLNRPLLAYIDDTLHQRHPDETLTVILPELIVAHWWETILHNQTALRLKAALLFRPGIVVVNIPHHLHEA